MTELSTEYISKMSVKDIRCSTLQATYLRLQELLSVANKDQLKKLIANHDGVEWDAFDESIRMIIVDDMELYNEMKHLLFENNLNVRNLTRRAVKCKWFFKLHVEMSARASIMPIPFDDVSLSTRLKLISGFAKAGLKEADQENMLSSVDRAYGVRVAEPLLAGCSEQFISIVVDKKLNLLHSSTLIAITRRFPALGARMADKLLTEKKSVPEKVAKILFKHPKILESWDDAKLERMPHVIGRKLLRKWKTRLIAMDYKTMSSILGFAYVCSSAVVRLFRSMDHNRKVVHLCQTVKLIHSRITIEKWQEADDSFKKLLSWMKPNEKEAILEETFFKIYQRNLWESQAALTPTLLELTSDSRRAKMLTQHSLNNQEYWYLLPPAESLPKYIQRIKQTPDTQERICLLKLMARSCRLARDVDAMAEFVKFLGEFMASHGIVAQKVMVDLRDNHLALTRLLDVASSEILVEILRRNSNANGSMINNDFSVFYELYISKILGSHQVSSTIDSWLLYLSTLLDNHVVPNIFRFLENPDVKTVLGLIFDMLPKYLIQKRLYQQSCYKFIEIFMNLSKLHKIDLSMYPKTLAAIREYCTNDNYFMPWSVMHLIWSGLKDEFDLFLPFTKKWVAWPQFIVVLRKYPDYFIENLSEIIDQITIYRRREILKYRAFIAFCGVEKDIVKKCADEFIKGHDRYLWFFAGFASFDEYENLVKEYFIDGSRVDTSKNSSRNILALECLRFQSPTPRLFPLLRGCLIGGGDLFYSALHAFQKVCHNIPPNEALAEILPLLDAPVAVMKKAAGMVSQICTQNAAIALFAEKSETARHYSAKTVLLSHVANIFMDEPSAESWQVLKKCIVSAVTDSNRLVNILPSFRTMPNAFAEDYAATLLDLLPEDGEEDWMKMIRKNLFDSMASWLNCISHDFCRKVLKSAFMKFSAVNELSLKFLLLEPGSIIEKVEFLKSIYDEQPRTPQQFTAFVKSILTEDLILIAKFLPIIAEVFHECLEDSRVFISKWAIKYLQAILRTFPDGVVLEKDVATVGRDIAKMWLEDPEVLSVYSLLVAPLMAVFRFEERYLLHALLGVLDSGEDARLCIVVLNCLPNSIYIEDDVGGNNIDDCLTSKILRIVNTAVQMLLKEYMLKASCDY